VPSVLQLRVLHLRTPAPSPYGDDCDDYCDYGRPAYRAGAEAQQARGQRARSASPEQPSYEAPPAWRNPDAAGRPRSPPPVRPATAAGGEAAWGARARAQRKHFHDGYAPQADGAGLLYGEALRGRAHAQRSHAVPLPPPPPRPASPRRGVKQQQHVHGGGALVTRGERGDDQAEAQGIAHWRAGGRTQLRRAAPEQQRPATANPMDMTLREEEGRARTPGRRGRGLPASDLLGADAAPRVHQVWPPGRPSTSWQPSMTANKLQPAHASLAHRGAADRPRADVIAELMVHGVRSDRAPRPSRTAIMPRSRGDEYALNRQRCNGTSLELTAPPLYEVRPGTAPSWS